MIELDQFTEPARRALSLADYEARYLVTGAIEPGHLLFGVVQEATELVERLSRGRLVPAWVRQRLKQEYAGRLQAGPWEAEEMKLSGDAQSVLAAAQQEAQGRGHAMVGLSHLLLALLGGKDSVPARLLAEAGITRGAVDSLLKDEPPGGTSTITLER